MTLTALLLRPIPQLPSLILNLFFMAAITSAPTVFGADTSIVDTVKQHPLLTRGFDTSGNEYIYLQGVSSCVKYSAVTYDEVGVTTLTVADAVGPVAIAQAILDATTEYGWFQIFGSGFVRSADDVADNKALVLTSEAGELDDADVAGDRLTGIWSRAAITGEGALAVQLNYPMAHDVAID